MANKIKQDKKRFFYPAEFERVLDCLNKNGKFTALLMINTGARINEPNTEHLPTKKTIFNKNKFKALCYNSARAFTIPINYSCILGQKKFFEGKYNFKYRYGEDYYHILLTCGVSKFTYLPMKLGYYRTHKNSTTNKTRNIVRENCKKIRAELNLKW